MLSLKFIGFFLLLFFYYALGMVCVIFSAMEKNLPLALVLLTIPIVSIFFIIPIIFRYLYPDKSYRGLKIFKEVFIPFIACFTIIWIIGLEGGYIVPIVCLLFTIPLSYKIIMYIPKHLIRSGSLEENPT